MRCKAAIAAVAGVLASVSATWATPSYSIVILQPSGFGESRGMGGTSGQQVGYAGSAGTRYHAILWRGSANQYVDLTPSGGGYAYDTDGLQQVGEAGAHAALWTGTADSLVDLHPAGWEISDAYGVGGGQQVGAAFSPTSGSHAMLWTGSAQSAVDLHPAGFRQSVASGTNGSYQVGYGYTTDGFFQRALMWHGSAESVVDLTPPGSSEAVAIAMAGRQIVGRFIASGRYSSEVHAVIWNDLGASFTDVNPAGTADSEILATSGEWQAGDVAGALAYVWHGTADSAVNLHDFLPPNYRTSRAFGVDASGNVVGEAYDEVAGQYRAVLWLIPEPNLGLVLTAWAIVRLSRRRRS